MKHPDDQLVDYVDGSLDAAGRTSVDTHLAGCARCRNEVVMGRAARTALAALPDEHIPAPVAQAILREAGSPSVRNGAPVWYRWAGVAAAAAVVALIAVTLPSLGGGEREADVAQQAASAPGTNGLGGTTAPEGLTLQVSEERLTRESIQGVALSYRTAYAADASTEANPNVQGSALSSGMLRAKPEGTQAALDCVRAAFEGLPAEPVRLIEATYEGTRAYIAITLTGPGAGQPPDMVNIWIAAKTDCSILVFTEALLDPGAGG